MMKHDAFLACRGHFFGYGQQQVVVNVDHGALTPRAASRVDGGIATADHCHPRTQCRRLLGAHAVQVVEPAEHSGALLAGNLETPLLPRAGG